MRSLVFLLTLLPAAFMSSADAQDVKRLEHMLMQDCGSCHGLTMKGGLGRPLTREALAGCRCGHPRSHHPRRSAGNGHAAVAVRSHRGRSPLDGQLPEEGKLAMTERRHVLGLLAAAVFCRFRLFEPAIYPAAQAILGLLSSAPRDPYWLSTGQSVLPWGRIEGLGDLSHASLTYSPDERYAYVFGRDGGLTKVDIIACAIAKRVVQAGNSIGGAISDDGRLVAVSNYEPGGVRVFDAASLELVADIPTGAKTIGLADVPGRRFIWSQWETGEAWIADFSGETLSVSRLGDVGRESLRWRPDRRWADLSCWALRRKGRDRHRSLGAEPHARPVPQGLWQDSPKISRFSRCRICRAGPLPTASSFCQQSAVMSCSGLSGQAWSRRAGRRCMASLCSSLPSRRAPMYG